MKDYPSDPDYIETIRLKCPACSSLGLDNLIILSRKKINRTTQRMFVRCLVCSNQEQILVH